MLEIGAGISNRFPSVGFLVVSLSKNNHENHGPHMLHA